MKASLLLQNRLPEMVAKAFECNTHEPIGTQNEPIGTPNDRLGHISVPACSELKGRGLGNLPLALKATPRHAVCPSDPVGAVWGAPELPSLAHFTGGLGGK